MSFFGAKFHQQMREKQKEVAQSSFDDFNVEIYNNTEIQTWTDSQNRPRLRVYVGRSGKPVADYYYHTTELRAAAISRHKSDDDKITKWKADKKSMREKLTNIYKVGDILYSRWGYGQTNITFYKVVGITPKSVKVIEISQKRDSSTSAAMSEYVIPNPNKEIGEVMVRRISKYGISINNVEQASLWNGTRKLQTYYY